MGARFNEILIVDSIPAGEHNTAQSLVRDMQDWRTAVGGSPPSIAMVRVESAGEFESLIEESAELAGEGGYVPLLHIECHGSNEGLAFADGSALTWVAIAKLFTLLNIATRLNLVVMIAACFGVDIIRQMNISGRAPVWGIIAPTDEIQSSHLEQAFSAFYGALFTTGNTSTAYRAMKQTPAGPRFLQVSTEEIFKRVCIGYVGTYETDDELRVRAIRMQKSVLAHGVFYSVEELERRLRDLKIFEEFRDNFFMVDLFDDHDARFPSYSAVLREQRDAKQKVARPTDSLHS